MPTFWIRYSPLLEMQHELCEDHIQKLSEGLTGMRAPLTETSTLAMPDDEAIHKEYHIPMTTNRLVISHLILCFGYRVASVKPKIIFAMQIEFVYPPRSRGQACHGSSIHEAEMAHH